MSAALNTYLKLVPYFDFDLWDVKRYYRTDNLNFENVVSLKKILKPFKKSVSKEENEKLNFFNDKPVAGSLSMTSVKIG